MIAMKASLVPDHIGKRCRKWLSFILMGLDWSVDKIHDEYRRRFGVECIYRLLRRIRATTISHNPVLRFFLLGVVGLILVNASVFLRWEFARLQTCGPRRVDEPRFRLHCFSKILVRTIENLYGKISAIQTFQSPQSVISAIQTFQSPQSVISAIPNLKLDLRWLRNDFQAFLHKDE
jgi:hypothetical protein